MCLCVSHTKFIRYFFLKSALQLIYFQKKFSPKQTKKFQKFLPIYNVPPWITVKCVITGHIGLSRPRQPASSSLGHDLYLVLKCKCTHLINFPWSLSHSTLPKVRWPIVFWKSNLDFFLNKSKRRDRNQTVYNSKIQKIFCYSLELRVSLLEWLFSKNSFQNGYPS